MSNLELAEHMIQLQLAAPALTLLMHFTNTANNIAALSWVHFGSMSVDNPSAALLCWHAMLLRQHQFVSSAFYLLDNYNVMVDA
eukprot:8328634-Ditylum_brightwellii.AAC.1